MRVITLLIIFIFMLNVFASEEEATDFISMAWAARDGDIESVQALLDKGIDPDGRNINPDDGDASYLATHFGRPLLYASGAGHLELVKLLLINGANPDGCCCDCITALHMAIANGHEELANHLIKNGANTNLPYSTTDKTFDSCYELALDKGLLSTAKLIKNK